MYLYLAKLLRKAIYLYLLCVPLADGKRKVAISVNGDLVVQTNTTTYTIYSDGRGTSPRTLTISCLSFLRVPSTVSLLRNGTIARSSYTNHSLLTQFEYIEKNAADLQGVYACVLNLSSSTPRGSQFKYFIQSEIEIKTTSVLEVCASSVGSLGYVGEKVTLLCGNSDYSLHANFSQAEQNLRSRYFLQVSLIQSNATLCCLILRYNTPPQTVCSHNFTVYQSLQINISPKLFTVDSHALKFSCSSTPPRLLYWQLIGDDGKILNLNNIGDIPEADGINVEIMQRAGWSSLLISTLTESNITLSIQKVVCYAYGTLARSVASAYHESILESTATPTVHQCTCPPQPTSSCSGCNAENATTTIVSTNGNPTEQENTNPIQDSNNARQSCHNVTINKKEEINMWVTIAVGSSVIASAEALVLVIIAGIYTCHKCRTGDKNQSSKSGLTVDIISSDTELHPNPVYQSYDS